MFRNAVMSMMYNDKSRSCDVALEMASGTDEFSVEGLIGGLIEGLIVGGLVVGGLVVGGLIDICTVSLKLGSGVVDAGVVDAGVVYSEVVDTGVGEGFAVTTVGMKSSLELTIVSQQFA